MPPSATVIGRGERRRASGPLDCMFDACPLDSDPVISQALATLVPGQPTRPAAFAGS